MNEQITLSFLEAIKSDAETRASYVQEANTELELIRGVTLSVKNSAQIPGALTDAALWKCRSALSRDDVLEAMMARLIETGEGRLSDGEIKMIVRSIDPDLVKI